MAAKQKKSLKKFAKNRLTNVITKRRQLKPIVKEMRARTERRRDREAREMNDEENTHLQQLKDLEAEDSEFVDFLRKEEPELLEFGEDVFGADVDDEEGEEGEEGDDEVGDEEISKQDVERCYENAFEKETVSLASLKNASAAFRSAVQRLYLRQNPLSDTSVYVNAIQGAIKKFAGAFDRFLQRKPGGTLPKKCAKYKQLAPVARAFVTNATLIVTSDSVDKTTLAFVFHHLGESAPEYIGNFPIMIKRLLRVALRCCADLDDEALRECSCLFVRGCARTLGATIRETCFKGMFLSVMAVAKQWGPGTSQAIGYIIQSIVDMYGMDVVLAYQTVFVYIKQLAMYLRTALLQPNDESAIRNLHNWQYVIALRTWAAVVCEYSDSTELWPLVYPLAQVCVGVLDVFASSRAFPLHFQLLDILNTIAERCDVHIPLTPYLIRVFQCPMLLSKSLTIGKGEEGAQHHIPFMLRVHKTALKSVGYQTVVLQELMYQTTRHTAASAHRISFPETFALLHACIRKFRKSCPRAQWGGMVHEYLKRVQMTEDLVRQRRGQVSFGPCDDSQVDMWEAALKEDGKLAIVQYMKTLRKRREDSVGMMVRQAQESHRQTLEDIADGSDDNVEAEDELEDA
eukprot:PhM_4_TR14776/c0_g1_i1/m.74185/K14833/NOC2; nucleolar complex protein 2